MARTYTQIAGTMPSITSIAWRDWYRKLLASRIAYCSATRANTYYFAQAGNDTTGAGTLASPWKTIAKAQAMHDASSSGNIALLFNKGDEWNETTGLTLTKPNVTVGSYGTGAKPLFSTFANNIAASGWTQAGATDRWTRTTAAVGWIRETGDDTKLFSPLKYVTSTGLVESTPRSWFWASNTLHVNLGTALDPNATTFEWTAAIADDGITASGDGTLIDGIRVDGWGCIAATESTNWGIKLLNIDNDEIVVQNCEAYYVGRHTIGQETATIGGVCTFYNCTSGYVEDAGVNSNPFISYCRDGDNEAIFDNCVCRFGQLPNPSIDTTAYAGISAFYAHANSTSQVRLVLWSQCSSTYESGLTSPVFAAPLIYGDSANFPGTEGTLSTYRAICSQFSCTGLPTTMVCPYTGFSAKTAYVNCNFTIKLGGTSFNISGTAGGHFLNCLFDYSEWTAGSNPGRNLLTSGGSSVSGVFVHCHFRMDGVVNAGQTWYLSYRGDTTTNTGVYFVNCLFSRVGDREIDTGTTNLNLASRVIGNAKYGSTVNISNDPYLITLTAAASATASPTAEFLNRGRPDALSLPLEYDMFWRPRGDSYSQGPIEVLRCPKHLANAIRTMITSKPLATEVINAIEAGSATLSDRAKRAIRIGVAKRAVASNLIASIEAGTEPSEMTTQQMGKVFGDRRIAEWLRLILAAA